MEISTSSSDIFHNDTRDVYNDELMTTNIVICTLLLICIFGYICVCCIHTNKRK